MSFSRCWAVLSVAASGGSSSLSVYLAQVLFRDEVGYRTSGSSACAYLHLGLLASPTPPYGVDFEEICRKLVHDPTLKK